MAVKGRLLSSTAVVKHFQAELQALLPVGIPQSRVVLENLCGGATRPRKMFDDLFIHFDTICASDSPRLMALYKCAFDLMT